MSIRQYQIMDELGRGAYSVVCKAKNTIDNKTYAVKICPKDKLADQGDYDRFQREINAMAFIRHPSIVSLHDFFWDEENYYLILDFCPGGELFDYIVDHEKLDEGAAALIFCQIVDALKYCHDLGVAHRDLKPENVLIDSFPHVKVSDFGLCGYINGMNMMKTFCGSPCYCAPECLCRIQYDGRLADVWSLGVILFAMVTGEHPWNISNTSIMIRQILKGAYTVPSFVSNQCNDLIKKMLKVNPRDRISIENILNHPWMKLADKSRLNLDKENLEQLPSLEGLTIEEIAMASAKSSQRSNHGIISPFEDADDSSFPSLTSLPKLCIRSSSLLDLRDEKALKETEKTVQMGSRWRYKPKPRASLQSQGRQRSAFNLLVPQRRKSKISPMMTILEDA